MSKSDNSFDDYEQAWSNTEPATKRPDEFATQQFGERHYSQQPTPQPTPPSAQPLPYSTEYGHQRSASSAGYIIGGLVAGLVAVIAIFGAVVAISSNDTNPTAVADLSTENGTEPPAPKTVTRTQQAPVTQTTTHTETRTETAPAASAATEPTEFSGQRKFSELSGREFAQRAFLMDREDLDAKGWIGSTARCGDGDYARIVAETPEGRAVICENSYNRQQQYYLGDFGPEPEAYAVTKIAGRTVTATNKQYEYELSPTDLTVYEDGEIVFHNDVVDWGSLQAG